MKQLGTAGIYTAIFAALGPFIGAACFLVFMQLGSPGSSSFSDLHSPGMSLAYVFLIFGAYLLGSIPSAVTGFVLGLIAYRLESGRLMHALLGSGIGLLACGSYQTILAAIQGDATAQTWHFLVAGSLSGMVCGLACSFVPVGPNNSFKPSPHQGGA